MFLRLRTDASQAHKRRCGALGSTGSPIGVWGAETGNTQRLTISATRSDRQSTALEVKRVDDNIRQAAAHVPVLEMLLQVVAKPGRAFRWEHVPAGVNVQGNEVANGLAMDGMCSSPLWSQQVP